MPRLLLLLSLLSGSLLSHAQTNYFQQQVDYDIDVSLDDKQHMLRGFETLTYTNHSTDTLRHVYMHLWANAFKNDRSKYTEQSVENGQTAFYYSAEEQRGKIDSVQFKVNNDIVNISQYDNHEDIVVMELNEPLAPEKSINISTSFRVKIPYTFSRLGHIEQSYQITQWYPKPAVYDKHGWHPLPYLDQGEFYGEYGNYLVRITLPSNNVVAATGEVQEESEKLFIKSRLVTKDSSIAAIDTPVVSSLQTKTISFKQSNIHDFAWFADKKLIVEKTEAVLPSGKKVDCISYYKPGSRTIYKGSSAIIAQTISYLSAHVGEYPYKHASIVEGALIAGDGMEYPTIAVISGTGSASDLQKVIIHEVGHNWFYGLLGSHERDHPWMDESINSYYEKEINASMNSETSPTKLEARVTSFSDKINGIFLYQLAARENTDQAANLPATAFSYFNYGGMVYQKAPAFFGYLKNYLGEQTFEKAMKRYFKEWHFKHPSPDDFKKILREESGKDLDWFFEDGLGSTKKIDFKIKTVSRQGSHAIVSAKSRTGFRGPIPVQACIGSEVAQTRWIQYPYTSKADFTDLPSGITSFTIDAKQTIPELNISNNQYRTYSLFHRFQPAIRFGTGFGITSKRTLYLLPAAGYNFYDKLMLGGVLHNLELPNHKFQFALIPLYSTGSKQMTGSGFVSYTILPRHHVQQITFALQARTYHHNESNLNISRSIYLRHIKLMPSATIDFNKATARSTASNQLSLRYYHILNQTFRYMMDLTDSLYRPAIDKYSRAQFGSVTFNHKNIRTFNPFSYTAHVVGNHQFAKATLEASLKIDYAQKGKAFYARVFGGKFFDFKNSTNVFALQNQYLNAASSASNDYLYDQVYLGRNEQQGLLSKQIALREGGFKIKTQLLSDPIGQNSNWLTAINLRTDLPIKLPLKFQLFVDAATYAGAASMNSSSKKAIYDAGIELHLFKEMINVYFPLLMSDDLQQYIKSTYTKNRFLQTISFSFNIDRIDWFKTQKIINLLN